jgi:hypothetical protein
MRPWDVVVPASADDDHISESGRKEIGALIEGTGLTPFEFPFQEAP